MIRTNGFMDGSAEVVHTLYVVQLGHGNGAATATATVPPLLLL
jgi:hypothetical protein